MMKVLSQFFHSISTDALASKPLINNKKMNIACIFSNAAGNKADYHNSVAEAFNGEYWGPLVFSAITGGTQTQHWRGGGVGRSLILLAFLFTFKSGIRGVKP